MSTNPIHGITGPQGVPGQRQQNQEEAGVDFRRLLEKLQKMQPPEADEQHELRKAHDFFDAMKQADEEYHSVMDLRQQLEQAYRSRQG